MANTSILAAFERMWQHVTSALNKKSDISHNHDDMYYTETEIDTKISAVNTSISNITSGNTVVKEATHAVSADSATSATSAMSADSATKATQDGSGNVITSTYETKTDAQTKLDTAKEYTDTKTSGLASTNVVDTKIATHNTATDAHNDIRASISDLNTKVTNFLDVDDTTKDQLSEVITMIDNNKGTLESLTTSKVNVSDIVDNLTTASADKVLSANQGVALKNLIDGLDKADVGLSEVNNTSDADKPVSTAQAAAIADAKKAGTDAQTNLETHNTSTTAHEDIRTSIAAVSSATNVAQSTADTAKTNAATAQSKADSAYALAGTKVDKVDGMGLSTNDYTDTEKAKLAGIDDGANYYTLPVATSAAIGGVKSGTDITIDSSGNVSINDDSHNHIISNVDGLQSALNEKQNVITGTSGQFVVIGSDGNVTTKTIANAEEASF